MKRLLSAALLCVLTLPLLAQAPENWFRPVEPVRIAGNLYYVGTEELGAYLLVGKEGAILLDAPMDENVELILRNVKTLGHEPSKIRILLNSHAHLDHIGGMARMKEATGGKLYLSAADAELAARGGRNDFAFGDTLAYPPVKADAIVKHGETIRLGDVALTAVLTPGHTRGCTTWRTTVVENGKPLEVVFLCSVSTPGYTLVGNERYPTILDDYRRSYERLRAIEADIFLANHGSFFALPAKLAKRKQGGANPFIDRAEFPEFLEDAWKRLQAEVEKQKKGR